MVLEKTNNSSPSAAQPLSDALQTQRPLLSVVIPALNESGIIDRLLLDLLTDKPKDLEIIVCDSHSEDDTALIVEQFTRQYPGQVTLVKAPQRGVSLARNLAAEKATGDYLAFLDADSRITSQTLLNGVTEMRDRGLIAAVFKFQPSSAFLPDHLLVSLFNLSIGIAQYLAPTAPGAAGYLVKREAHQQSSGFNETMHFGEDVEYLRRVSDTGTYRVLRQGRIQWDMRRFNEEGRLNVIWKMFYGTLAQIKNPAITDVPFDYKVGHFGTLPKQESAEKVFVPKVFAQHYQVMGRLPRLIPAEMADVSHFLKKPLAQVDFLQIMKEKGRNISPYCLDDTRHCLIFVETPSTIDPLTADPFFYEAQRDHAQYLYAVPYGSLGTLTAQLVDKDAPKTVFLHSTGRCGSTLLSQLMSSSEDVVSVSEPDFYSQAMMLSSTAKKPADRDQELRQLMFHCTELLSHFIRLRHPNGSLHLIKLRSWALFGAHLLDWQGKAATHLFMYRDALATINSFLNAYFSQKQYRFWRRFKLDTLLLRGLGSIPWTRAALGATVPLFNHPDFKEEGRQGAAQYFTLQWLSHMAKAEALQRQNPNFFAMILRYEDLKQQPIETLEQIIRAIKGKESQLNEATLQALLSRNSQQGARMQSKGEQLINAENKGPVTALIAKLKLGALFQKEA